jgi:hypothetical protein
MRSLIITFGWLAMVGFLSVFTLVGYVVCIAPSPSFEQKVLMRAEEEARAEAERAAEEARPAMSASNFNKVREGMTYQQVVAILGEPTKTLNRQQLGDIEAVIHEWEGGGFMFAHGLFENGILASKTLSFRNGR